MLHTIYRGLLSVPAHYAIRRMVADGLPSALVAPLEYLVHPVIAPSDQRILAPIESLRAALLQRTDDEPIGFDSPDPNRGDDKCLTVGKLRRFPWQWLATKTSVTRYWGIFLYLCAKHMRAQTILEVGACAGMSGCYLSAGEPNRQLITVEGSPGLAALAETNLRVMNPRARIVNAMFDDALDEWLPKLSGTLDIVHIDGQHERVSMLHYFERVKTHLRPGALVIFDDIHWSDDMRQAWDELCKSRGLSASINVGRYGICIWEGGDRQPRLYNFSRYARNWRQEKRPAPECCDL